MACGESAGRRLGCAPDTFLGSAAQTTRAALDSGAIGEPIAVSAFLTHTRLEEWHPDPTFLFTTGGGPLLDMGPYYIANLVNCLGPIVEVAGATRIGANTRTMSAPDRLVEAIEVAVPTHATAVLRFANGAVGTLMMSFDVWHFDLPFIEIYGTLGALRLADPNGFDGDVLLKLNQESEWRVLPPVLAESGRPGTDDQMLRGMGVAELALSLNGGPHRTNAALAFHTLEVLESIEVSSTSHEVVRMTSTCERPAPLAPGELGGVFAGAASTPTAGAG
jgi:predicted dehydrogenase